MEFLSIFIAHGLQLKYIYIYIKVKVGCLEIAIPCYIRSIVTDLSGRGLVAIQATRPTSTFTCTHNVSSYIVNGRETKIQECIDVVGTL